MARIERASAIQHLCCFSILRGAAYEIAFTSITEVEAALGRSLTYWEGVWWNGTHKVSDYMLYCMNIIFLFIIFTFAPLPYVLLYAWKVRSAEKYKVQPGVQNEPSETWRCYKVVMWTFFTVVGPLHRRTMKPAVKFMGLRFGLPLPSIGELEALETHSGYDFPWNPTHLIPFYGGDYHHFVGGKSQSNFASVFTYCDWLYGTDKGYRYMKEMHKKEAIAKGKAQQLKENGWLQTDDLKAVPVSLSKGTKSS